MPRFEKTRAPENSETQQTYYYSQVLCGSCGRYISDVGGFVPPDSVVGTDSGERRTPGADLLNSHPRLFTRVASDQVLKFRHNAPLGLAPAISSVIPVRLDPNFPYIYLQPHLCCHTDHDSKGSDNTLLQKNSADSDGTCEQQTLTGGTFWDEF